MRNELSRVRPTYCEHIIQGKAFSTYVPAEFDDQENLPVLGDDTVIGQI
jgi:hypothetical protein